MKNKGFVLPMEFLVMICQYVIWETKYMSRVLDNDAKYVTAQTSKVSRRGSYGATTRSRATMER